MRQLYNCRFDADSALQSCTTESICEARQNGAFVEYEIDTTNINYFNNWYHQMDLMCMSQSQIFAFGSVFFVCAGISGSAFSALAEISGRRKTILYAQGVSIISQLILLFCPGYYIRLIASGLCGLC